MTDPFQPSPQPPRPLWLTALATLTGNLFLLVGSVILAVVTILVSWIPPRGIWAFAVMRIWATALLAAEPDPRRGPLLAGAGAGEELRLPRQPPEPVRHPGADRDLARPAAHDGQAEPVPDPHLRLGAESGRLHPRRPRRPQHRQPELRPGVRRGCGRAPRSSSSPRGPARSTTRSSPSSAAASCWP